MRTAQAAQAIAMKSNQLLFSQILFDRARQKSDIVLIDLV